MAYRFLDLPRYQRQIQRIQALGPEERAILNTSMVDAAFGANEMKKRLQAMATAADVKAKTKSLEMAKREMDVGFELGREAQDFRKGQQRLGTAISIANIPIAGILGYKQAKRDKEQARLNRLLIGKFTGGLK